MQIKFLTIYHDFEDVEYSKREAQDRLLYLWMRSLQLKNIKFISKAQVDFKDYAIKEYPNQEIARKEIWKTYANKDKKTKKWEFYWCGKHYSDFDTLYEALSKQKKLMELTITVEDE